MIYEWSAQHLSSTKGSLRVAGSIPKVINDLMGLAVKKGEEHIQISTLSNQPFWRESHMSLPSRLDWKGVLEMSEHRLLKQ